MFEEMLLSAKQRLEGRDPEELAKNSGVVFDAEKNLLVVKSLNEEIEIRLPEYSFVQEVEEWQQLVLLHYLDLGDGTPASEELITFGNLKDGLIRGTKFDRTLVQGLEKFLKGKTEKELCTICEELGGEQVKSNADICMKFDFLPNYPLWLKIWLADEEFEASGKLLLSKSADHYLTVEDAVIVGEIFLTKLHRQAVNKIMSVITSQMNRK